MQDVKHLIKIPPTLTHVDETKLDQALQTAWADNMTQQETYQLIQETASGMTTEHHHYSKFAGRVWVHDLHQRTKTFTQTMLTVKHLLNDEFVNTILKHDIDKLIRPERDYQYDIFACKTMERSYLLKHNGDTIETPQFMLMRVAIAVSQTFQQIKQNYEAMSTLKYTHATPTLFHAGMKTQQLASCFLMTMKSDSIAGIYDTLKTCALISKGAGGIGLSISQIRPAGSKISGTNGVSNGIIPMLKVFNDTARYVDQGGGKRKGSFSIWLEPWHPDIKDFLDLKKNHGDENKRARDLFYGLWIPDLFMKRVQEGKQWSLFCPNKCSKLQDTYGDEFERHYLQYEKQNKAHATIDARELWLAICDSQIETGTPYLMYKDAVNHKSNQKNLGTIRSSNLCCEVCEYTAPDEIAVCTLASIALPKCIEQQTFDFQKLIQITKLVVNNLNRVIDINVYPVPEAKANLKHRPMGIGVQGLADVFQILNLPYDSKEALQLNNQIFETMYFAALTQSVEIAKHVGPYETFMGSPASKGILQFDLWGVQPTMYDWKELKQNIMKHGLRNSLLIAPMPTASTAQILGNTESFEPRTTNLYTRRVLAGEYMIINPYLQDKLMELGLWNQTIRDTLIKDRGSVKNMDIPQTMKDVFKTVWEMSQKSLIDLSVGRGAFVCQSQSLNLYIQNPTRAVLSSMGMYAWSKGLKTGQYYLRSQPNARATQFTVCNSCSS